MTKRVAKIYSIVAFVVLLGLGLGLAVVGQALAQSPTPGMPCEILVKSHPEFGSDPIYADGQAAELSPIPPANLTRQYDFPISYTGILTGNYDFGVELLATGAQTGEGTQATVRVQYSLDGQTKHWYKVGQIEEFLTESESYFFEIGPGSRIYTIRLEFWGPMGWNLTQVVDLDQIKIVALGPDCVPVETPTPSASPTMSATIVAPTPTPEAGCVEVVEASYNLGSFFDSSGLVVEAAGSGSVPDGSAAIFTRTQPDYGFFVYSLPGIISGTWIIDSIWSEAGHVYRTPGYVNKACGASVDSDGWQQMGNGWSYSGSGQGSICSVKFGIHNNYIFGGKSATVNFDGATITLTGCFEALPTPPAPTPGSGTPTPGPTPDTPGFPGELCEPRELDDSWLNWFIAPISAGHYATCKIRLVSQNVSGFWTTMATVVYLFQEVINVDGTQTGLLGCSIGGLRFAIRNFIIGSKYLYPLWTVLMAFLAFKLGLDGIKMIVSGTFINSFGSLIPSSSPGPGSPGKVDPGFLRDMPNFDSTNWRR